MLYRYVPSAMPNFSSKVENLRSTMLFKRCFLLLFHSVCLGITADVLVVRTFDELHNRSSEVRKAKVYTIN